MPLFEILAVLYAGLCLGSFATALASRLPEGRSVIWDKKSGPARSACPSCGHALKLVDLFPLFSWIVARGKCRYCHAALSRRYPLMEAGAAVLALSFYAVEGFTPAFLALLGLVPVLISIVDIDLRLKIIPDMLNLAVAVLGLAYFLLGNSPFSGASIVALVAGAALYGGLSFLLRFFFWLGLKKEALGLGDVKFFAAAGVWLGLSLETLTVFLFVSGISGVVLALAWRKTTGDPEFPFGPALVLAFITSMLYGKYGFWLSSL